MNKKRDINDEQNLEFAKRARKRKKEAQEWYATLSPEEKKIFDEARRRHWRKDGW